MPTLQKPAIALLSNHEVFRQSVNALLMAHGLGPVLELDDKTKLLEGTQRKPIDIVIIDLDYEGEGTIELMHAIRRDLPELQIVLLATPQRPPTAETNGDKVDTIVPEVDAEALIAVLVQGFRAETADKLPHRNWSRITARQRDVLRWLATGLDNATIGQRLRIGERAVKAHISSLLALFGLENRTQLALLADRGGMRPPRR